jgi:predicted MFS family arabinose efflux permease
MLTREFRKLWIGQTVSAIGSSVTLLALPLTAALYLDATPEQMGFLTAAGWLPYLLFALFIGVWVDRLPRKPILVITDLARAAILVTIPIAAYLGVLSITHVLLAAFVAGAMTVLFRNAYGPFIPVLVGRDALIEANSRLAISESTARVVGPSLGGVLVQTLTAPFAILVDALSFLVSAVAILAVRVTESTPARAERRSMFAEIADGIRFMFGFSFVRAVVIIGLLFNVSITIGDAVFILYATRGLGLDGALIGGVFTISGLASVAGAALVQRTTKRFGIGPSMMGAIFLLTVAGLLMLAAGGSPLVAATFLAARGAMVGFAASVFNVSSNTAYQAAVPSRMFGRVTGAGQVLSVGMIPISAVLGGYLGEHIGLWNTLAVSVGGQFLSLLYVVISPLRAIRTTDDVVAAMPTTV